jgi:hypothetical protein
LTQLFYFLAVKINSCETLYTKKAARAQEKDVEALMNE